MNYKKLLEKYVYYLQNSLCKVGDLIPSENVFIDGTFDKIFSLEEREELRKISKTQSKNN